MRRIRFPLLLLALAAAGCRPDAAPLGPVVPEPQVATRSVNLRCTVDVRRGTLACEPASPAAGTARKLIVGGQNLYLTLASANTGYDSATQRLTSDVTVKNLMPQLLGTSDGVTPDPTGIRVFFLSGPTVISGTGSVSVVADGTDAFTGAAQPYYQYAGALLGPDGMLSQNETSSPRTWTFAGPPTVGQFTFQVAVWTTVPLPDGWIELTPASDSVPVGGSVLFSPTVYTAVGRVRTGVVPWWSSSNPAVATVDSASGQVRGIAAGSATVTAHYGNATGSAAVHVYEVAGPQFVSVSSFDHSCGLAPGGIAWCWGNDSDGQLGIGVVDTAKAPNAVPRAVTGGHAFQEVATGYASSCGLDTGGEVWCWGSNQYGQLGVASTPETCVLNGSVTYACSSTPLPLSGTLRFTSLVSSGGLFWCGIAVGGDSYCWGNDQFGQLGDSTSTAAQVPVLPVKVSGGHRFTVLTAGYQHACGLEADGKAYCWGTYLNGRLGVAATGYCPHNGPCNSAPTAVLGTLRFKSISATSVSTCAVTTDGVAYCWGTNFWGQMGTGGTSETPVSTPTAVNTSLRFKSISAAPTHTCAVAVDGQGYCWGSNTEGRLGDGTEVDRDVPRLVAGGHIFTSISAGTGSSCGLAVNGQVYCWGFGGWGQMGDGSLTWINPTPVPVATHP